MNVQGTYWIGNIDITCECGYSDNYIVNEDDPFDDNNIWTCPECGKKISVAYFIDDCVYENIDFEEIESEDDESETD